MVSEEVTETQSRRLLVERIAASELFCRSPRLRELLCYVADCTLDNRPDDVREQVVAERVFGRRLEINGGHDSIVRAEARNLRKRLELYFDTEGKEEPVIVSMPKGGYLVAFQARRPIEVMPTVAERTVSPLPLPEASQTHAPATAQLAYKLLCLVLALIVMALGALSWHWYSKQAARQDQLAIQEPVLPFSALFAHGQEVLIVTSDTGLLQISSLAHRRITLDEYMARTYPVVPHLQPPDLIQNWNLYEFTDGREMAVAGLISRNNAQFARQISLRSGHQVQLQDFHDHTAVLIGSPISNPWAQLYEESLNFRCDLDRDGRILFRDVLPRQRESAQYPNADDIAHNRTYARIAFLPATSDTSSTLLIAGTTAQSTQAAGELVTDKQRWANTLRSIGIDPEGPSRFFEILIRSNNFVGGAILPEVVAWRKRPRS